MNLRDLGNDGTLLDDSLVIESVSVPMGCRAAGMFFASMCSPAQVPPTVNAGQSEGKHYSLSSMAEKVL